MSILVSIISNNVMDVINASSRYEENLVGNVYIIDSFFYSQGVDRLE